MENTFASPFTGLFGLKKVKILMLGFDAVGKTTILHQLKLGEVVTTIPTIGFSVERVNYKNISFTVWDVGSQNRLRSSWENYFQGAHHLIFVVDSNDRERIREAREELTRLLDAKELQNVSVLVLANKQDLPDSMQPAEIIKKMGLLSFQIRKWHLQPTCAVSGDGLLEGLDWLASQTLGRSMGEGEIVTPEVATSKLIQLSFHLMSNAYSYLSKRFFGNQETRIIMLGLDAVGKTWILYKLKLINEIITTIPTIGFNVETITYRKMNFNMWDVGGGDKIRPLWRQYFDDKTHLMFVVDSTDRERIGKAGEELVRLLANEELQHAKVLIVANKQDLPNAMTPAEITERLGLHHSLQNFSWNIQATSASTGHGLYESLDWYLDQLQN